MKIRFDDENVGGDDTQEEPQDEQPEEGGDEEKPSEEPSEGGDKEE